ncbi:hypothetical protein MMIC_P1885 [Mariprofundus micogutta]|uniref:Uncharacterized protein n=1 Tax=Mariprofundus micogutta TaxID=1921010 RepID=A0A1L8CQ04_9PROT|nr:hypothetical protein [Mariprofundus micogutta]GAV20909.1 hypothetical protein MMIC_P1885 [Mariprofundus micogutta]
MNPEELSFEALSLFNALSSDGQRQACHLAESLPEDEAVYLAAMRSMPKAKRRQFLFSLSKKRWGL